MPRSKGSENRAAKFSNYQPRRWHPEFDLIVIGSVSGKSNEELAKAFGYGKQHISNILSTKQAQELKDKIRSEIGKQFEGKLQERISLVGEKAIEKIESFINDDSHYLRSPFNFVDRAIKIAQLTNAIGGDPSNSSGGSQSAGTVINGNAIIINGDKGNDLLAGLEKSRSLDEVQVGEIKRIA